jgi:pSer/pThr/pTyr-binding forkhead associated (FHA) protein
MSKTLPQPATLLVKLHGQGSRSLELTHETLTMGRKADNTLVIEDPAVSGHHARIVKVQSVFFLEDLMSTNGTAINGRPITRHQLHDADVITIGRHRLIFQELTEDGTTAQDPCVDLNRTMVLKRSDPSPNEPTLMATVFVIAGKLTGQNIHS